MSRLWRHVALKTLEGFIWKAHKDFFCRDGCYSCKTQDLTGLPKRLRKRDHVPCLRRVHCASIISSERSAVRYCPSGKEEWSTDLGQRAQRFCCICPLSELSDYVGRGCLSSQPRPRRAAYRWSGPRTRSVSEPLGLSKCEVCHEILNSSA